MDVILQELGAAEGKAIDLGGYYHPDPEKMQAAMRQVPPSIQSWTACSMSLDGLSACAAEALVLALFDERPFHILTITE